MLDEVMMTLKCYDGFENVSLIEKKVISLIYHVRNLPKKLGMVYVFLI